MNERIRELALQASGGSHYLHTHGQPIQKFAYLIVQECIDVVDTGGEFVSRPKMVERLKQHFGVEE